MCRCATPTDQEFERAQDHLLGRRATVSSSGTIHYGKNQEGGPAARCVGGAAERRVASGAADGRAAWRWRGGGTWRRRGAAAERGGGGLQRREWSRPVRCRREEATMLSESLSRGMHVMRLHLPFPSGDSQMFLSNS